MEKCMVFKLRKELVFIDSTQFLNSSLESLVKNLPKDKFKYMPQEFQEKATTISKKGNIFIGSNG